MLNSAPAPTDVQALSLTTFSWACRAVWIGTLWVTAVACCWAPPMLTELFPAVAPNAAFTGVCVAAGLLALLAVPPIIARQLSATMPLRSAWFIAMREVGLLLLLALPLMVATWKHAPHTDAALFGALVILAASLGAASAWGLADARHGGRWSRHISGVACALLATPVLAYVLWDYADRQPWWLMIFDPPWLLADSVPPRLAVTASPLFAPCLLLWLGLALAGGVAAWPRRSWVGGLCGSGVSVGAVLAALGLMALSPSVGAVPQPPKPTETALLHEPPPASSSSSLRWQIPSVSLPSYYWLAVDEVPRTLTADAPPAAITSSGTAHPALLLHHTAAVRFGDTTLPTPPALQPQPSGFVAAVLVGRIGLGAFELRSAHQAFITLTPSQIPRHQALLKPVTAIVLATVERDEISDQTLQILADWVRGGGLMLYTGFQTSALVWRDLLSALGCGTPPINPIRGRSSGPWRAGKSAAGAAQPLTWLECDAGAGIVVRLELPATLQAPKDAAVAIGGWLSQRVPAMMDPLTSLELDAGGRLLGAKHFTTALRHPVRGSVPAGSLPFALFIIGLGIGVAMLAAHGYRLSHHTATALVALVCLVLGVALALFMPAREADVIQAPVWVCRADEGPCREVRFTVVTAVKDVEHALRVELPADCEVLPAANTSSELLTLPWRLTWPSESTNPTTNGESLAMRVEFSGLRSGEYRLLRTEGLTDQPPGIRRDHQGRIWVGAATRLLAVIDVQGFTARPVVADVSADELNLEVDPTRTRPVWWPYRNVVGALERGELFPTLRGVVDEREWRFMAQAVRAAVRAPHRFLAALVATPPPSRLAVNGTRTVLRPLVFVPLTGAEG